MRQDVGFAIVWAGIVGIELIISPEGNAAALSQLRSETAPCLSFALAQQPDLTPNPLPPSHENPFLQPTPLPAPLPPEPNPIAPSPPPAPAAAPSNSDIQIPVEQIQVVGSTVFSDQDLAPLIQPFEGRSLTLEELRAIADSITQLYLDGGYLTSRAVLVDQQIVQKTVQIRVIEGSLERIEIEGAHRVNSNYIRDRIALGGKAPLNQGHLEDQLRLLRLDPLFDNVEASLRPGNSLGQSILVVRVTEANPFSATVGVDNYSPPSVGSERTGVAIGYLNPTGLGDALQGSYFRSTTGGSNVFNFSYQVPLNAMNGGLQLQVAPSSYKITDPKFAPLNIQGNSNQYALSYRQPLLRSPREEFALSLGLTYETGETLVSSFLADTSTTSVISFGQDYVRRDPAGAWAARSQFNLGTRLFEATHGSTPDGQFFSWLGQFQRVQILNPDHLLITQLDVQLTPNPLLPSQQFVIGGGQSIRGYQQNIRLGDNGFRFSIEDRITVQRDPNGNPLLQLAPFTDLGAVWNTSTNPNPLPDQNFLAGLGFGVLWQPWPHLNVRADFAVPLVNLSDRGNNLQDSGVYFSVNWQY
ncbi:MAG TPA: ShlB/FhaC/HecB family hemolysin secretion/activation protein [Coleofasciculaceae cyanobacterium]